MKASRLEVLQGASRNGEMSLRNTENNYPQIGKVQSSADEKHISVSMHHFYGHLYTFVL